MILSLVIDLIYTPGCNIGLHRWIICLKYLHWSNRFSPWKPFSLRHGLPFSDRPLVCQAFTHFGMIYFILFGSDSFWSSWRLRAWSIISTMNYILQALYHWFGRWWINSLPSYHASYAFSLQFWFVFYILGSLDENREPGLWKNFEEKHGDGKYRLGVLGGFTFSILFYCSFGSQWKQSIFCTMTLHNPEYGNLNEITNPYRLTMLFFAYPPCRHWICITHPYGHFKRSVSTLGFRWDQASSLFGRGWLMVWSWSLPVSIALDYRAIKTPWVLPGHFPILLGLYFLFSSRTGEEVMTRLYPDSYHRKKG